MPIPGKSHAHRSDVASAPLKLLSNYAEERCVGKRRQRKGFLCFADGDD